MYISTYHHISIHIPRIQKHNLVQIYQHGRAFHAGMGGRIPNETVQTGQFEARWEHVNLNCRWFRGSFLINIMYSDTDIVAILLPNHEVKH